MIVLSQNISRTTVDNQKTYRECNHVQVEIPDDVGAVYLANCNGKLGYHDIEDKPPTHNNEVGKYRNKNIGPILCHCEAQRYICIERIRVRQPAIAANFQD